MSTDLTTMLRIMGMPRCIEAADLIDAMNAVGIRQEQIIIGLEAERDALRADAERYRWLRATTNYATSNGERVDVRNKPDLWDAAIDAAMKGTT